MKTISSSISGAEQHNALSLARPIVVSLAFFLIVIALRSIDLFVLRLDDLPDESIFSKVFGFLLVLGYLRVLRKPISSIGLHARNFDKAFLLGALSLLILYATLYAVQFSRLSIAGESPRLVFAAIDQQTGTMGGLFVTSFHLFGQLFNAFMEEAIFRGVLLPHLMRRFSFWKANALQALLFGLAHLVFPLSSWVRGEAMPGEAAAQAAALMVFTTVGGLVFGYLYYRTDSLWTAVFAHLLDNIIGLFFHIQMVDRLNAETDILMLARFGFIALVILAWAVSRHFNLPNLKQWAANERQASFTEVT
jgi:membrane protease YdiL (CAAX protease family)